MTTTTTMIVTATRKSTIHNGHHDHDGPKGK